MVSKLISSEHAICTLKHHHNSKSKVCLMTCVFCCFVWLRLCMGLGRWMGLWGWAWAPACAGAARPGRARARAARMQPRARRAALRGARRAPGTVKGQRPQRALVRACWCTHVRGHASTCVQARRACHHRHTGACHSDFDVSSHRAGHVGDVIPPLKIFSVLSPWCVC